VNVDAVRSLFLAIELGSFSAAGAQLGVPPSTVSRRVSDLEAHLDGRLLVRTGRGVRPAEEASETLSRLRDVLIAVDACYVPLQPISRLRVTAPSEMAISLLPALLPRFAASHPGVHVEVYGSDRTVGLIEERFDLAIRAGPLADSSYLAKPLRAAPLVIVAAPAMAEGLRSAEDLAGTPTVRVGSSPAVLTGQWDGEPFSTAAPSVARVDSFTAAVPLALAGHGWIVAPPHVVAQEVASGRLAVVQAARFDEAVLHALYPRRHRKQAALHEFIALVSEALGMGLG